MCQPSSANDEMTRAMVYEGLSGVIFYREVKIHVMLML